MAKLIFECPECGSCNTTMSFRRGRASVVCRTCRSTFVLEGVTVKTKKARTRVVVDPLTGQEKLVPDKFMKRRKPKPVAAKVPSKKTSPN